MLRVIGSNLNSIGYNLSRSYHVAVVGAAGRMGSIMTKYLVDQNTVFGCVRKESQLEAVADCYVFPTLDLGEAVEKADYVVLAVKQRDMGDVLSQLNGLSLKPKTLMSLAAGLPLSYYKSRTDWPVIRVMPNVLIRPRHGVIGLCASPTLDEQWFEMSQMFRSLRICRVEESEFDRFMLATSCSPAVYALLVKYMISAYTNLGLTEANAVYLLRGIWPSVLSHIHDQKDCDTLIESVSSPGGATERIIADLNVESYIEAVVRSAMVKGLDRCQEICEEYQEK
jgi:pyrroline-5-carboxylate reductase